MLTQNRQYSWVLRRRREPVNALLPEDWTTPGTAVVHTTFGTGVVAHVGPHKGEVAVWVDFDRGDRKMLLPEAAEPHIRLRTGRDRTTAPAANIRCDVCGCRPVVVSVLGPGRKQQQQVCEDHRSSLR